MPRLFPALLFIAGCGGVMIAPPHLKVAEMQIVAGAPTETTRPVRLKEGTFSAPSALFIEGGAIAVVDQGAVSVRNDAGVFSQVAVGGVSGHGAGRDAPRGGRVARNRHGTLPRRERPGAALAVVGRPGEQSGPLPRQCWFWRGRGAVGHRDRGHAHQRGGCVRPSR
jgi:hypothetical protein